MPTAPAAAVSLLTQFPFAAMQPGVGVIVLVGFAVAVNVTVAVAVEVAVAVSVAVGVAVGTDVLLGCKVGVGAAVCASAVVCAVPPHPANRTKQITMLIEWIVFITASGNA